MRTRSLVLPSLLAAGLASLSMLTPSRADAQMGGYVPVNRPQARGSVKLFDTDRVIYGIEGHVGTLWYRPTEDPSADFSHGTFEISVGQVITTRVKAFYLSGIIETLFRVFDGKSYAWSLTHHALAAGIALGPVEPEVRVGFSSITGDVFRGDWSFEMLTPRVSGGVALHFGPVRIGGHAFSEYLWRWFGTNYLVQGIALDFRFETGHPKPQVPIRTRGSEKE